MAERIDQRTEQTGQKRDKLDELRDDPVFPQASNLPTDSNPVPESPTDPMHRTSAGDTGVADERKVIPVVPVGPANTGGAGTGGSPAAIPLAGVRDVDNGDGDPRRDDEVVRNDSEGAV